MSDATPEQEEWASQFVCERHGRCTYDMVTTKKTCLKCESEGRGQILLIRGDFPRVVTDAIPIESVVKKPTSIMEAVFEAATAAPRGAVTCPFCPWWVCVTSTLPAFERVQKEELEKAKHLKKAHGVVNSFRISLALLSEMKKILREEAVGFPADSFTKAVFLDHLGDAYIMDREELSEYFETGKGTCWVRNGRRWRLTP